MCVLADPALAEVSGLASDGEQLYAVADGGTQLRVVILDRTCAVTGELTNPLDPYDVEDLELGSDGALWLSDTGDNARQRDTVAVHRLTMDGEATLYRLTYPDGPHDAEALLVDPAGVPYVITKEPLQPAGIYRPSGPLVSPGPTPLERVGSVSLPSTDTPGGPFGSLGSVLVTAGSMNQAGDVIALRTYTDAYLFAVPDGDIVAALTDTAAPARIPLPHEPQGEALAIEPDGTLLSASEGTAMVRAVPGAVERLGPVETSEPPAPPAPGDQAAGPSDAGRTEGPALEAWQAAIVAGGIATVIIVIWSRRR